MGPHSDVGKAGCSINDRAHLCRVRREQQTGEAVISMPNHRLTRVQDQG